MSVGTQLKQARKDRTLSFADVTEQTKIQPWVLEAIEADRLHELMSPIYVKGFITTYAKFLHVAPEPLVAQLPRPAPEPAQEELPAPSFSLPALSIPWSPRLGRRLGVSLAALAAVAAVITINPARWVSARWSLRSVTESKLASVTPVKKPLKPPASPTLTLLATQPLELEVTARQSTWVQIRADGKLLAQQRLPRGANERWTATKQFEIVITKPSQVELILNGQPISPLAMAHQGRILITHHGITRLPDRE